ncbi:hypothetical protein D3C85_1441200 [compost metagenome]
MQTSRFLVTGSTELSACMQDRKYDLRCRNTGLMHARRNTAAIILNSNRLIFMYRDINFGTMLRQMLIDCIIYDFPDQMMKT